MNLADQNALPQRWDQHRNLVCGYDGSQVDICQNLVLPLQDDGGIT